MLFYESIFPTDLVIRQTRVGGRPTEDSSGRSFARLNCRTVRGKENSTKTLYVFHGWRSKMAEGGDCERDPHEEAVEEQRNPKRW